MKNKDTMSLQRSLIMEADVMVSNQYDQFCVGGMPEHSVEAAHVVVPVLRRNRQTHTDKSDRQTRTRETHLLILGKVGRNNGISEGHPGNLLRMGPGLGGWMEEWGRGQGAGEEALI